MISFRQIKFSIKYEVAAFDCVKRDIVLAMLFIVFVVAFILVRKSTKFGSHFCTIYSTVHQILTVTNKIASDSFEVKLHDFVINDSYPGRGLAVNFRKKCGEMRWKKISPRISYIILRWMRWIAVNYFFHRVLTILSKKNRPHPGSNFWPPACLQLLIPLRLLALTY